MASHAQGPLCHPVSLKGEGREKDQRAEQSAASRTHTRYVVVRTDPLGQQPVSDFPGEDGRALPLVLGYLADHFWSCHSGFAATNGPGPDGAGLVIPAQNLTHTAVGHLHGEVGRKPHY